MMQGGSHPYSTTHGYPVTAQGGALGMTQQPMMMGFPQAALGMQQVVPMPFAMQPPIYHMPPNSGVMGQHVFVPPSFSAMPGHFYPPAHCKPDTAPVSADVQQHLAEVAKQRHFAEQHRRLQEFGTLGSRKLDADTLIESILGKSDSQRGKQPSKTGTVTVSTAPQSAVVASQDNNVDSTSVDTDDGFGDFLSSPLTVTTANLSAVANDVAVDTTTVDNSSSTVITASDTTVTTSSVAAVGDTKKDLISMMMQCSDLSDGSKNARSFAKKPTVREVTVTKFATPVTYSESRTSRSWTADKNDTLSELFTLPAPVVPAQPAVQVHAVQHPARPRFGSMSSSADSGITFPLPRWVTGDLPAPDIYHQVLQASISGDGGNIETELVYPILLRSNLPREVLGYIWELCNKASPGQLTREELFLILAMISIAQNNMNYSSLSILSRCPQAPVPNLGQYDQHVPAPCSNPVLENHDDTQCRTQNIPCPPVLSQAVKHMAPGVHPQMDGGVVAVGHEVAAHFSAGTPSQQPAHAFGDPVSHMSMSANLHSTAGTVSGSHQSPEDDDFTDFLAAPYGSAAGGNAVISQPATSLGVNFTSSLQPMPDNNLMRESDDKYAVFRMLATGDVDQPEISHDVPANNFSQLSNCQTEEFAEFEAFQGDPVSPQAPLSFASAVSSDVCYHTDLSKGISLSAGLSTSTAAGFPLPDAVPQTSCVTRLSLSESAGAPTDKYQLIRDLVSNPSLFKPASGVQNDSATNEREANEWADFQGPPTDQIHDVFGTTKPVSEFGLLNNDEIHSSQQPVLASEDEWADFQSPQLPGVTKDYAQTAVQDYNDEFLDRKLPSKTVDGAKGTSRVDWLDESKVSSWFSARQPAKDIGYGKGSTASFGSAAFDISPPEFPPENEDDDLDDFGTFSSSAGGHGVSSLSTVDFDDDFGGIAKLPKALSHNVVSGGIADAVPGASLDFTGWNSSKRKGGDDQSMNSLDFRNFAGNASAAGVRSQDDSPSHGVCDDNQSVSSFEFGTLPYGRNAHVDGCDNEIRSVKSLELKATAMSSPEEDVPTGTTSTVQMSPGGHLSSRAVSDSVGWFPGRERKSSSGPVNIKDLLDDGSLGIFGDPYSHLMPDMQANERHAYEWERCLEQCRHSLVEADEIFGSVSNTSVCHEVASVKKGAAFLAALTEVYLVARRISVEMKAVSISNARLALLVQDIESTWTNLAGIFANIPNMASCLTLDLTPVILRAEDDGSREKACGLCLLNVDWSPMAWPKLSYGGRQYHAACANFWINFVDLTLPSLTIPELL